MALPSINTLIPLPLSEVKTAFDGTYAFTIKPVKAIIAIVIIAFFITLKFCSYTEYRASIMPKWQLPVNEGVNYVNPCTFPGEMI